MMPPRTSTMARTRKSHAARFRKPSGRSRGENLPTSTRRAISKTSALRPVTSSNGSKLGVVHGGASESTRVTESSSSGSKEMRRRFGSGTITTVSKLKRFCLPTNRRPSSPGEILDYEFRQPLGLTQEHLAKRLNTTVQTVNRLIRGKQAVTPEMAIRLAEALGTTPQLWLSLQADCDLWDRITANKP